MKKPENPFDKGTVTWSVMEGDWEDLTTAQIAEVLDCPASTVYSVFRTIRQKTGRAVPHAKSRRGRPVRE